MNLHGEYGVKVSRGVAIIGLEQYALSWVETSRRINVFINLYDFGRQSQAIARSWGVS